MQTWCEQQGQCEVGVIKHEGREFRALGASVAGKHVTGYTRLGTGDIELTTWCGNTTLACRSEVVEAYHGGALALVFRLTRGRFVIGYALGDHGMLFRGELLADGCENEVRRAARQVASYYAELDAFDEYMASQHEDEEGL